MCVSVLGDNKIVIKLTYFFCDAVFVWSFEQQTSPLRKVGHFDDAASRNFSGNYTSGDVGIVVSQQEKTNASGEACQYASRNATFVQPGVPRIVSVCKAAPFSVE